MQYYRSKSGKPSGVIAYSSGTNFITVQFRSREVYTYSYASAGKISVEEMKKRAAAGAGLSTYITRHAPQYE